MLKGAGSFSGALQNNGIYSPGNSPTLETISSFAQGSTGTLEMELGGLTHGAQYDALAITGSFQPGGTLTLSLINSFNPASGATFDLFDFGSVSGTFGTLSLPSLDNGLVWDSSALYSTGTLTVITSAIPEPSTSAIALGATALGLAIWRRRRELRSAHCPSTHAKINGATMVASLSMTNFGVFAPSLPQVIFSFGTAPE